VFDLKRNGCSEYPGIRNTTVLKPDHFDSRYPVNPDYPCDWLEAGCHPLSDLLVSLKSGLPFLLRYETHADQRGATVTIPALGTPVRDILTAVVGELPKGWQATVLGGYAILYKKVQDYPQASFVARS